MPRPQGIGQNPGDDAKSGLALRLPALCAAGRPESDHRCNSSTWAVTMIRQTDDCPVIEGPSKAAGKNFVDDERA
jgi:hypothetical protein